MFGVADLRPELPYERHKSLVKSIISPAIASKAPEYRSRRSRDSVTMNSANSSSLSWSVSAAISFSMNCRCRSMEARAKACVSVGFGVLKLEFGAPVCVVLGVWIAESFAASEQRVRSASLSSP